MEQNLAFNLGLIFSHCWGSTHELPGFVWLVRLLASSLLASGIVPFDLFRWFFPKPQVASSHGCAHQHSAEDSWWILVALWKVLSLSAAFLTPGCAVGTLVTLAFLDWQFSLFFPEKLDSCRLGHLQGSPLFIAPSGMAILCSWPCPFLKKVLSDGRVNPISCYSILAV